MLETFEWWTRIHRTDPPVTLTIVKTPSDVLYIVGAEGWPVPSHVERFYEFLWDAQRAVDDALLAYRSHDCRAQRCGEWNPSTAEHVVMPPNPSRQ